MQGIDGFLGTRATFMLDFVALALLALLPLLGWSIYLVKYRRRYVLHKWIQVALGFILLVTVGMFEADMRINGWRHLAAASPYGSHEGSIDWIVVALGIHLCFAITTAVLWILVTVQGLRHFPNPPAPNAHSHWHRRYGQLAAYDLLCTAITGWIFYYMAFVA